MQIGEIPS